MTFPTIGVSIGFGYEPFDAAAIFTDVDPYVRVDPPVQIVRGRTSERSAYQAGTAMLTLDNRDRRFDPTYTSGPYYGDLKPGVQIRISGSHPSGPGARLFTGFVTGWPQSFTKNGMDSTVTIQCVDALAWLNRARVPEDVLYDAHTAIPNVDMFLRGTDDYLWNDEVGTSSASMIFGVRNAGGSLCAGSASPSIVFNGATMWSLPSPFNNVSLGSVSFWMQTSATPTAQMAVFGNTEKSVPGPTYYGSQVNVTSDGKLNWGYAFSIGSGTRTSARRVNDGQPHFIVLTVDSINGFCDIYIDGQLDASTSTGSGLARIGISALGTGSLQWDDSTYLGSNEFFSGALQDLCVWDERLSATQIKDLYDLSSGFVVEPAADRLGRALDSVDFPASLRDIPDLFATCGRLVFGGRTGLEMLQEVERTEQGYVFADASGQIVARDRYWHQVDVSPFYGTTSQATFSDDGAGIAYSGEFGFLLDDLDIRNDIIVNALPSGRGRAKDAASIAAYGDQSLALDTVLSTPQSAADMATGLLHKYGDPAWRSRQMVVYPVNGDVWSTMFGLDLTYRITQEVTPMGVGSQVVHDMLIGRIEWIIGPAYAWECSILGEPVPPDFFLLDTSSLDGAEPLGF